MSLSRALFALLVSVSVVLTTGCETLSTSNTPPPSSQTTAVDTTDLDPRIVRLYAFEAKLLSTTDSARVGAILNQAMAELAGLLESDPDLIRRTDVRELYRGLTAEYRRYHGYSNDPDSMVTAHGSIFAVRAKLFATLEDVNDPTLQGAMRPDTAEVVETTIPLTTNRVVKQSIEYLKDEPERHFNVWLRRAQTYFPMIDQILKEEDVPPELRYLAMVESGLNPTARSWAGAAGMWQFMRGTARQYGLSVNGWVDERRDPEKATRAAARHMRDLYERFGDWHLAMAAYNCGAGCVGRAVRRSPESDPSYWDVYDDLPRETRGYVPMFIATTRLASNPGAHGFDTPSPTPPFAYDYVAVHGSMLPLQEIAELAGTSARVIRELNPELRRSTLPPSKDMYSLRIPVGSYETFAAAYAELPDRKKRPATTYTVKRGDTLSEIAEDYGTSTRALRRANGIRGSIIRVGQALVVPVREYDSALAGTSDSSTPARVQYASEPVIRELDPINAPRESTVADASTSSDAAPEASDTASSSPADAAGSPDNGASASSESAAEDRSLSPSSYTVRRGDTLGEIAEQFDVSTRELRQWNNLASSRIRVGQTLQLQSTGGSGDATLTYRVERGDTLGKIAQQFGVSTRELRAWNGLSSSRIIVGQRLTIHRDGSAAVHVVQRGDTLDAIAQSYGVTIQKLRRINGLNGSRIYPGQEIKVTAN